MTVTGAVVIALFLGPMAWLVLRGDRAARRPRTVENLPPARQRSPSPR